MEQVVVCFLLAGVHPNNLNDISRSIDTFSVLVSFYIYTQLLCFGLDEAI